MSDATAAEPRTVELVAIDGEPAYYVDAATGRRFGTPLLLVMEMAAGSDAATATLSYMRLKNSQDGTLPSDRLVAPTLFLDDEGKPEAATEKVQVARGRLAAKAMLERLSRRLDPADQAAATAISAPKIAAVENGDVFVLKLLHPGIRHLDPGHTLWKMAVAAGLIVDPQRPVP